MAKKMPRRLVALSSTAIAAVYAAGPAMATVVNIEVVSADPAGAQQATARALGWFAAVERACSRFDAESELSRLCRSVGHPVAVSALLYQPLGFALALAAATNGAFDPTVGAALHRLGFDQPWRGQGPVPQPAPQPRGDWRDITLDDTTQEVTLHAPLLLDLGAVAKGLAIDLAAVELAAFPGWCIEAGGDLRVHGLRGDGQPWHIGIQHPRLDQTAATLLHLTEGAVCTSGDYERRTADGLGHHLLNARTGHPADALASATVLAPTAMAADGLATAAFVLGPAAGHRLLRREGVRGIFITPDGKLTDIGVGSAQ